MEDGVAFLAQGAECERDRAIAQLDVARLAHNVVGVGDDEVGESAVVFFESLGALGVGLTGHFCAEVGELLAELLDLRLGLEVLEGTTDGRIGKADGDGTEGAGVQLGMSLHNIERALWREGMAVAADAGYDFTFLGIRVRCDGELWAFDGGLDRFGSWCAREWNGRGVDESDGRGGKFRLYRVCGDGGLDVVEGSVGLSGGGHVGVVWKCW